MSVVKFTYIGLFLVLLLPSFLHAAPSAQQYDAMGSALAEKGFYSQALEYFKAAVAADPYDWQGYENLGNAYLRLNQYQEAHDSFEKSLQINPRNPDLKLQLDNLNNQGAPLPVNPAMPIGATAASANPPQPTMAMTATQIITHASSPIPTINPAPPVSQPTMAATAFTPPKPAPASSRPWINGMNPIDTASFWVRAEGGYGYSFLFDLANSASIENKLISANNWTGSSLVDNNSLFGGLQFGFLIDPHNGLAIGAAYLRPNDDHFNQNLKNGSPSDFEDESFSFCGIPLSLEYYYFLPDPSGRFFFSAGAAYYFTVMHVNDNFSYLITHPGSTDADNFAGDLTGGGFGFQASAGREFALNSNLGISVFVRGRYAKVGNLTGTVITVNGQGEKYGLAKFPDGEVHAIDTSVIGNVGITYAAVDFTGVDAGIGISFYP